MTIETIREDVKPVMMPVKEVVMRLSVDEFKALREALAETPYYKSADFHLWSQMDDTPL